MFEFLGFLTLLLLGFFVGRFLEKRHYASIKQRELEFINLPAINTKYPLSDKPVQNANLVSGSVTISSDYFKDFYAGTINFFGGHVAPYESLIDRARREAILRMKSSCAGADEVINLRIETASINQSSKGITTIEAIAYGTAIYYKK